MAATARAVALALVLAAVLPAWAAAYDPNTALQYAYLAGAAYCDQSAIQSWSCGICGNVGTVNVTAYLYDSNLNNAGFVGIMPDGVTGVVSFRGTIPESLENWVEDLDAAKATPFSLTECDGCEVHSGFLDAYAGLRDAMLNTLSAQGTSNLIVTGHSLGGAMAAIAAFDLTAQGYSVSAITFGQPRVGNKVFAQAYDNSVTSNRVVHWADIVPHLPTLDMGFYHVATEVWYQSDNVNFQVCNGSGEDPNCSDSLALSLSIADHLQYMGFAISESC